MRAQLIRVLVVLTCLVFGAVGASSPAAAAAKKKSWASKKHHHKTHHRSSKPASASSKGAPAPADEAEEDDGEGSAEQGDTSKEDAKAKAPKAKAKGNGASGDDGEREASDDDKASGGDDDDEGGSAGVVHRKARKPVVAEGGAAPSAVELAAGPRIIHRSFSFNDPLSNYNQSAKPPYSYVLDKAPAPFVDLAFYPAAFATRGFASQLGLVASYEKLVGTKTLAADGSSFDTFAQQLEVGARLRLPFDTSELGVTGTYGKHSFHVTESDAGPSPTGGATVPNVDYTFAGVGVDGRLRFSAFELGAHVGTRFVFNTGPLAKNWFPTTKTTSIGAGVSLAYQVTPSFGVVVGGDFLRYAFNFNPVPTNNLVVAGGAVDQYISGFLALRVTISGG